MISYRNSFFDHIAQTSTAPLLLDIVRAKGSYIYDRNGKCYIDLISGISVSHVGHCHPKIVSAIKKQAEKYLHVMVYGEFIQAPQVDFARCLSGLLPAKLGCTYFVNSGSEAVEGAVKLAKKYTGRNEIISFSNAYHGSTHGALSLMGDEKLKIPFRPLLPDVRIIEFNKMESLSAISSKTACVIIEPVQGEAGVRTADIAFIKEIRKITEKNKVLLIFDEIQTAFGRTGSMFAFEKYNIVPDILLLAKALGGGLPVGAFISSKRIMDVLKSNPALGHITTFGGHPLSCAAGLAALKIVTSKNLPEEALRKEKLFRKYLNHKDIVEIRGQGLLLAVQLKDFSRVSAVISLALKNGILIDWFLFNDSSIRIAPPLNIADSEIKISCQIINEALEKTKPGKKK